MQGQTGVSALGEHGRRKRRGSPLHVGVITVKPKEPFFVPWRAIYGKLKKEYSINLKKEGNLCDALAK